MPMRYLESAIVSEKIKSQWYGQQDCMYIVVVIVRTLVDRSYKDVFYVLMTPDLSQRTHPRLQFICTSQLFTYEKLLSVFTRGLSTPELHIIAPPLHPVASRNAPAHQHNMLPIEALTLSSGRDISDFSDL
ncbi:hypothetical protein BDR04DRAFT_1107733 [Suillus decipiens]|nr:hypothetical protein BDR04DRAFT_1107733 [Suillus decipiens]